MTLAVCAATHAAGPSIAAGGSHSLALHADGSVRAWGDDFSGELGQGRPFYLPSPVAVQSLTDVATVAAGAGHVLALRSDRTVWAWGSNFYGALGDGSNADRSAPVVAAGLSDVVAIAAGEFHSAALRSDGTVWTWGGNDFGQLGDGTHEGRNVPAQVPGVFGAQAIAVGARHTLVLRADGTVLAWGLNDAGQLGDGTTVDRATPVVVNGLAGIAAIAGGARHSIALKTEGTVLAWGRNDEGELGDGTHAGKTAPVAVIGLSGITAISAGLFQNLARRNDGTLWAWGETLLQQVTDGTHAAQVDQPTSVTLISAGYGGQNLVMRSDGSVWGWGHNSEGQLGDGTFISYGTPIQIAAWGSVAALSAGGSLSAVVRTDRTVLAAGANSAGQLGNGTRLFRAAPAGVALTGVASIATGGAESYAVKADGSAWSWGGNDYGQLGLGGGGYRSTPERLEGIANVVSIGAGDLHALAVKSDGTVAAWGFNGYGEIGDGTTSDRFGPVAVNGLAGVTAVAAGTYHSMALRSDGSVWTWGRNASGQLGDGTYTDRATPAAVPGLSGVRAISAGNLYSAALKSDGTVWKWGSNGVNVLGDAAGTDDQLAPTQVPGLSGIAAIAAANFHLLALKGDGSVLAIGFNDRGQLGDGTTEQSSSPVAVAGLKDAIAIAAHNVHSLALRADGTVFAWGDSQYGQVGDGTLANRSSPVVVLHEDGTGSVAAGNWFLDLNPAAAKNIPPEHVPLFPVVVSGSTPVDVSASVQYRAQDVGTSGSVFVFALAPATIVKEGVEKALVHSIARGTRGREAPAIERDTPVPCVLAQLNASGQLVGVSSSALQAYVTGVLTSQGQAVTILNGVPTVNIGGATFYVGYGPSSTAMINGGTNRSVVSVPGAVTCQPQAPQTGWWWNPAEDGRGFSIEVRGGHYFFASFLYDLSGRSTWYVSTGTGVSLDGSLITGDLLSARGGQTLGGAYPGSPTLTNVGAITLAFNDAQHGNMIWPGGTVPIQRFNIVQNGLTLPSVANQPESGWWWNPNESGRGFFLEWQGGTLDIAGYLYDEGGNSIWVLTEGGSSTTDPRGFASSWWSFANGQTLTGAWKPNTQTSNNVAPVTIQFSDSQNAIMTLPNGRTTSLTRHRF